MRVKPSISVIMPTLNEEGNLPRCVKSVCAAQERIVVDGGSRDQTVEDIGHAAVFLASEDSMNITGQSLMVDGGMVKI